MTSIKLDRRMWYVIQTCAVKHVHGQLKSESVTYADVMPERASLQIFCLVASSVSPLPPPLVTLTLHPTFGAPPALAVPGTLPYLASHVKANVCSKNVIQLQFSGFRTLFTAYESDVECLFAKTARIRRFVKQSHFRA